MSGNAVWRLQPSKAMSTRIKSYGSEAKYGDIYAIARSRTARIEKHMYNMQVAPLFDAPEIWN